MVSAFGPGAMYDSPDDSLLITGTDRWEKGNFLPLRHETLLYHLRRAGYPRLKELGVPQQNEYGNAIHIRVKTFPSWGMCRSCGRLQKRNPRARTGIQCPSRDCRGGADGKAQKTVPVRFVVACRNGHLDDFPWYRWTHGGGGADCNQDRAKLFLEGDPSRASLDYKYVRCGACGSRASLGRAISAGGMRPMYPDGCGGSMPWLGISERCTNRDNPDHHEFPRGMYKGATNMYFPESVRALTIPPFADPMAEKVVAAVEMMREQNKSFSEMEEVVPRMFEERRGGRVIEIIRAHRERADSPAAEDIKSEEYRQLDGRKHPECGADEPDFRTEPIEVPGSFADLVANAVLVRKLREIVALTGFYRVDPPAAKDDYRRRSRLDARPHGSTEWLPAMENRGEGIFIALDGPRVSEWAGSRADIAERCSRVSRERPYTEVTIGAAPDAKYVLLHTISHMLIREVSARAGYSTASIRERIYSGGDMHGILIYTSSPSSDGSLGGLVEQGIKPRLDTVMQRMLRKATACSTDPFCSAAPSGKGAACHACLFLPETACECMNELLDRTVAVSVAGTSGGFFG